MDELRSAFAAALGEAAKLSGMENPAEEPYKTRYEAREVLIAIRSRFLAEISDRMDRVRAAAGEAVGETALGLAADLGGDGVAGLDAFWAEGGAQLSELSELRAGADRIDARLGLNYIETEENAEGDRVVDTVLPRLVARALRCAQAMERRHAADERVPARWRCGALALCGDAARAANFLCLIWSGWGKHAAALRRLRAVKAAYNAVIRALRVTGGGAAPAPGAEEAKEDETAASAAPAGPGGAGGCGCEHGACEMGPGLGPSEESLGASLDLAVTHTQFYTAQVYTHLGEAGAARAGRYVERTLRRQVRGYEPVRRGSRRGAAGSDPAAASPAPAPDAAAGPSAYVHVIERESAGRFLDRVDWARNAVKLADVHRNRRRWSSAAHCASAARLMVAEAQRAAEAAGAAPPGGRTEEDEAAAAAWGGEAADRCRAEVRVAWGDVCRDVLRTARNREVGLATDTDQLGPAGEVGAPAARRRRRPGCPDEGGRCVAEAVAASLVGMPSGKAAAEAGPAGLGAAADSAMSRLERDAPSLGAAMAGVGADDVRGAMALFRGGSRSESARDADVDDTDSEWEDEPAGGETAGGDASPAEPFRDFVDAARAAFEAEPHLAEHPLDVPLCPERPAHEPPAVRAFPEARDLFLAASAEYKAAAEFFVLDGFVTDHVGICASVSALYKCLATWERDPKRACAMQQRRVAATAPLLGALNPSVYIVAHKELSMELGQAAQEALDLRVAAVEARMARDASSLSPRDLLAINVLADQATSLYNHFLRCYDVEARLAEGAGAGAGAGAAEAGEAAAAASGAGVAAAADTAASLRPGVPACVASGVALIAAVAQGQIAKKDPELRKSGGFAGGDLSALLVGATRLDDETVEAFLTAHFCIARLVGKRIDPANRVRDAAESLARYRWLIRFAPKLLESAAPGTFEQELAMCREMAELLPEKISRMHYGGETFGMLG